MPTQRKIPKTNKQNINISLMFCFIKSTFFAVSMVTEMFQILSKIPNNITMCEEKEIIMVMMLVLEPTTTAAETRGFLHANTSAKAVTAQVPTAWDHSRIILQQMFSFTVCIPTPCVIVQLTDRDE